MHSYHTCINFGCYLYILFFSFLEILSELYNFNFKLCTKMFNTVDILHLIVATHKWWLVT